MAVEASESDFDSETTDDETLLQQMVLKELLFIKWGVMYPNFLM